MNERAPLIQLMRLLPPPGEPWPIEERERWLKAWTATIDLIWPTEPEEA